MDLSEALVQAILPPPAACHSQLGGVPGEIDSAQRESALSYQRAAAEAMKAFNALVPHILLPPLNFSRETAAGKPIRPDGPDAALSRSGLTGTTPPVTSHPLSSENIPPLNSLPPSPSATMLTSSCCLIEELEDNEADAELLRQRAHKLTLKLMVIYATFAQDESLPSPWGTLTDEVGIAAAALEATLSEVLGLSDHGSNSVGSGSLDMMSQEEKRLQRLLAGVIPELLPQLRRAVVAAQPHPISERGTAAAAASSSGQASPSPSPTGQTLETSVVFPLSSSFDRAVAARCLSRLVRSTRHPFIGALVRKYVCFECFRCKVMILWYQSIDCRFYWPTATLDHHTPLRSPSSSRPYWQCSMIPPHLCASTGCGPSTTSPRRPYQQASGRSSSSPPLYLTCSY